MLKFEKERIIFPYILYINFFGKFYDSYILFIDKDQTDLSKREENLSKICQKEKIFVPLQRKSEI